MYSGVFVGLNGVRLLNDSLVDIDDIPDELILMYETVSTNPALNCTTDLRECCHTSVPGVSQNLGDWHYPDGSKVAFDIVGQNTIFRRNRAQSVVRLWRRGYPMERGRFRCELLNAQRVNQITYVNICELSH